MKTYNGHRSWNAWNVSLWIGNDESLYRFALDCIAEAKRIASEMSSRHNTPESLAYRASRYFLNVMGNSKTPDGATYNALSVKLALEGYMND